MKIFQLNCLLIFSMFILSCSEGTVYQGPDECLLTVYTDSSSIYQKISYTNNNRVSKIEKYNFKDDGLFYLGVTKHIYNAMGNLVRIERYNKDDLFSTKDTIIYGDNNELKEAYTLDPDDNTKLYYERFYTDVNLNVYKYRIYEFEGADSNLIRTYEYDYSGDNITEQEYTLGTSNFREIREFTYDDKKNPYGSKFPLEFFNKNNKLTEKVKTIQQSGNEIEYINNFKYEYKDDGYPLKSIKTSTINSDTITVYYEYECGK